MRSASQSSEFFDVKIQTGGLRWKALWVLGLPNFDHFMGAIILANLIVMIIETDRQARMITEDNFDHSVHWTEVFGWVVLTIFVLELVLRMIAYQRAFWQDYWNVGDFVIVTTDMVLSVIGLIAGQAFPVTILRVFRLAKLARVSKLLRVFPELRMLLAGFVHSLRAIFWGALLLWISLLMWSMMAVLIIHPLNKDIDYGDCVRCNRAYSSVMQAALTFWQQIVTGDSWGQVTIPLIEEHPATVLFFVPVFLSIGLSVMNLMLAVVVNAAQTAYENEGQVEEAEKALNQMKKHTAVLEICQKMDTDNSGELSFNEIYAGFEDDGEFRKTMEEMGITKEDFHIAWSIIDLDHSGSVSYKELVSFLFTMKDSDTQFMLTYIKQYITWIKNTLSQKMDVQQAESKNMEEKIQESINQVNLEQQALETALKSRVEENANIATDSDMQEQHAGFSGAEAPSTQYDLDVLGESLRSALQRPSLTAVPRPAPLAIPEKPPSGNSKKSQSWLYVRAGIDANAGMSSSVRNALQDLMQQFTNDVGRMHLELNGILTDMNSNACQRALPATSSERGLVSKEYSDTATYAI